MFISESIALRPRSGLRSGMYGVMDAAGRKSVYIRVCKEHTLRGQAGMVEGGEGKISASVAAVYNPLNKGDAVKTRAVTEAT